MSSRVHDHPHDAGDVLHGVLEQHEVHGGVRLRGQEGAESDIVQSRYRERNMEWRMRSQKLRQEKKVSTALPLLTRSYAPHYTL